MLWATRTKKNEAFWVLEGTWQGDREAQTWPCPNFPVNEWFLRGKNFHSFVYKPEGVGNPQIILVGTLKDCMQLHKNIQNFPPKFWRTCNCHLAIMHFFHMKQAASWRTVGCCVACATFTKIFYKGIGWVAVCTCKLNVFFISVSMGCSVEWDTLRVTVFLMCHWQCTLKFWR